MKIQPSFWSKNRNLHLRNFFSSTTLISYGSMFVFLRQAWGWVSTAISWILQRNFLCDHGEFIAMNVTVRDLRIVEYLSWMKLHKGLLRGMTSMMFQILGFMRVRYFKYAYQILFCFNYNTLLKLFEMIKIVLSYFLWEDMDIFSICMWLRGFYIWFWALRYFYIEASLQ